ncbi:MAG TPA: hypothetical protein VMV05_05420, partial [bacterium]|nr:hypothetical protein [bacterium]
TLHYSTEMMNFSFTVALACLFFVALLESLPNLSLGWIPPPWANALMGLTLSAWVQLHRTWVLILPLLLLSFYRRWRVSRNFQAPLYFLLGSLPLGALVLPTFLRPDYHLFRDVHGFSLTFNTHNLLSFFTTLVQFFAMACFEMPRFIGQHTGERFHFLAQHWLLGPGAFLWFFGFLQVLLLVVFLFYPHSVAGDWKAVRGLTGGMFLFTYLCFLFTVKNPDINTFYEILPLVLLDSLYVCNFFWSRPWGRTVLAFALLCSLIFEPSLALIRRTENNSFYLRYEGTMSQAIAQKNDHLLGERRPGFLY